MLIQHKLVGHKGLFFVEVAGNKLAELVYAVPSPGNMVIEHTEVNDELRGQHVGYQLVEAAVDHARKNKMKITSLCTFAQSVFDKKPEFGDVLA